MNDGGASNPSSTVAIAAGAGDNPGDNGTYLLGGFDFSEDVLP